MPTGSYESCRFHTGASLERRFVRSTRSSLKVIFRKKPGRWRASIDFEGVMGSLTPESANNEAESVLAGHLAANRAQCVHVIERTRHFAQKCRDREWPLVPCHADLHVGNVLTKGDADWIVDWDAPRLAPRECDLIFFLDGGILGGHGAAEEEAFREGYGPVSPDPAAMAYYFYARSLEDLVSFSDDVMGFHDHPFETRLESAHYFGKLFHRRGTIATAQRWAMRALNHDPASPSSAKTDGSN